VCGPRELYYRVFFVSRPLSSYEATKAGFRFFCLFRVVVFFVFRVNICFYCVRFSFFSIKREIGWEERVRNEWIGDFLTGRTQQTRVGAALSDINVIISRVIQGSCLGPVLFLLYINDLVDVFSDGVIFNCMLTT